MRLRTIHNKTYGIFPCLVAAVLLVTACQPVTRGDTSAANVPVAEAASATLSLQSTPTETAPASPTPILEASLAVADPQPPAAPVTATLTLAVTEPLIPARVTLASSGASSTAAGVRFVSDSVVNVRGGPGTTYPILGQLAAGDSFPAGATNTTRDWLQFDYQGQSAWISAGIVQIQGDLGNLAVSQNIPVPPPDRVVAPTIKLDSKIIPVGWHTEQTASGPVEVWDVASYAAGWLINSTTPGQVGNMVLSGHHNILGEVFRYVVNLKVGDPIIIYAGGKAYNYRVTDNFILADKYVAQQQRMDNGKWIGPFPDERLTLVTCWPYTNNTHRVIVIAKPVR